MSTRKAMAATVAARLMIRPARSCRWVAARKSEAIARVKTPGVLPA